jgi:hypothetical protein
MYCFLEFVDRKERESRRHLKITLKALKESGLHTYDHIDHEDSYIFVKSSNKNLPFEGIRIYEIGNSLAYRVQKEKDTEPFGKAYELNLEEMFNDLMGENMKKEQAGKEVIKGVNKEIKEFFSKSAKAQAAVEEMGESKPLVVKTGGTDYSGMVTSKM